MNKKEMEKKLNAQKNFGKKVEEVWSNDLKMCIREFAGCSIFDLKKNTSYINNHDFKMWVTVGAFYTQKSIISFSLDGKNKFEMKPDEMCKLYKYLYE